MADSPLLLMVQMDCSKEHLEPFTTWYNSHLPNLLRIPAYQWAQRYVDLESGTRFTALYGVRSAQDLPSLLQLGGPGLHPIAASEFSVFGALQGISSPVYNVYEQTGGAPLRDPLLLSDRPLSIITTDVDPAYEEEWDHWYTGSHLPGVLAVPGYACGARFRRFDHPALENFNTGPKYLAVYEVDNEGVLHTLVPGDRIRPEAQAELDRWQAYGALHARNFNWGVYRLISKHFKWPDL